MLTYEEMVTVKIDGKIVGTIKEVHGGWQYTPKGHGNKWAGDVYPSLKAVKLSLEDQTMLDIDDIIKVNNYVRIRARDGRIALKRAVQANHSENMAVRILLRLQDSDYTI